MQSSNPMRYIYLIMIALISFCILFSGGAIAPILPTFGQSQADTFEQVWKTVNDNFFDPKFNGVNWQAIHNQYRSRVNQTRSKSELAQVINQMLSELRTSHTQFYTPEEPAYYQILGIFLPRSPELQQKLKPVLTDGKPQYSGIGIFTRQHDGNTVIRAILDGSPAAKAGLRVGDRVLNVDGQPFHPIQSFAGKVDQPVKLLIQRSSAPNSQQEITVIPKIFDGTTMFLDAMKASVQVVEQSGKKIGYVHLWSYAGEQYQKQLETELFYGRLKDTDSFVLDLREGWGGASASYLNLYSSRNIQLTGTARNRTPSTSSSAWSKPVVMLINEESRSGKEILAYGFRKYGIGPVVGAKTAGAVLQGNLFAMNDGTVLYLAVADVRLDEHQRLEGVGVKPDIEIPFSLNDAQGLDPQKERAIAVALEAVKRQ
jgi:carboxyl-terminal processing protease